MTVYPARRALLGAGEPPSPYAPRRELLTAVRTTPMDWARRRRAERESRRVEAAGNRVLHRLDNLGPNWHIVEWPRSAGPATSWPTRDTKQQQVDQAGFLAIGPAGVYAVLIVDHGRTRVLLAGDVVQINGRRPPYVREATRESRRTSKALSAAAGVTIPVYPVLAFVGSGVLSVQGLPKDCLIASHRELPTLLSAGGQRISGTTTAKLAQLARRPATWMNPPYQPARADWSDASRAISAR